MRHERSLLAEDRYRITMAVAGFALEEIERTQEGKLRLVTGPKTPPNDKQQSYLHRGIANRSFKQKTFSLADHVKVEGASPENGLLSINLVREVPEQLKPRRIAPTGLRASGQPQQIEQNTLAAA